MAVTTLMCTKTNKNHQIVQVIDKMHYCQEALKVKRITGWDPSSRRKDSQIRGGSSKLKTELFDSIFILQKQITGFIKRNFSSYTDAEA